MARKEKWLILTGKGNALRGRFEGTRAEADRYCKDHYLANGYKIIKDKGIGKLLPQ